MPMGSKQNNDIIWLSLDVWKDRVFFNEQSFPAGYFAAAALDVSDDDMIELIKADVALVDLMMEWCERSLSFKRSAETWAFQRR